MAVSGRLNDYSTPELHSHSVHQLLRIDSGVSLLELENRKLALYGGSCAFLPAGCRHRTIALGGDIGYQSLYVRQEWLVGPPECRIFDLGDLGRSLFDRLTQEGPHLDMPIARSCLELFQLVISERINKETPGISLPRPSRVENQRLAEFLETQAHLPLHPGTDIEKRLRTLGDGLSLRQMTRNFKVDTGITPYAYLRLQRLLLASIRLRQGNDPVLAIAYDCGFASVSAFYAEFHRHFGLSPAVFRKSGVKNGKNG